MNKFKGMALIVVAIFTCVLSTTNINNAEAQVIAQESDCIVGARYVFNFQRFTFILKCDDRGDNYTCIVPCENSPNN